MNSKANEDQEEGSDEQQDVRIMDVAGSPSSHSNSSSSRLPRIVELLQENDNDDQPSEWMIRPEFYDEDVVQNSDNISSDESEEEPVQHMIQIIDGVDEDDLDPDAIMDEYELAPNEDDDDIEDLTNTDDSTGTDDESDQVANYDTALPAGHRYLGDNLVESSGIKILDDNLVISLPLFNLKDVALLPGQTLPLIASHRVDPRIESALKECIAKNYTTIGIVSDSLNNSLGTTAEIRNYYMPQEEISLIMIGRQRFKVLTSPFEKTEKGIIRILPEVTLGSPYPRNYSLMRWNTNLKLLDKFIVSKHPAWLLRSFEANNIVQRILDKIKDWGTADLIKDPNEFSYWLAANLPISNSERVKALGFACTEARLLWLLEMLEKSDVFGCSTCNNTICSKTDAFIMSQSGPQCSFVNPQGFVHDTLTVRTARGLIHGYNWSTEFTWFPGYAWRFAHCAGCQRHIGWCYKSTDAGMKPKRFFGLSRANIKLQSSSQRYDSSAAMRGNNDYED